jgi:hypothetical protein
MLSCRFSVLVSLRFLLKRLKFGAFDSDVFAAIRQFREWFEKLRKAW